VINNPVRVRLNAWLLVALNSYMHKKYAGIKSRLLAGDPSVVVELGPGSGANLHYLPAGTRLIAIEPNRQMHEALRRRAKQCGIDLDLRELAGENLDLASASVDFVFSSLVLCSVDRPEQVLAEVRRVLRPGGRFVCVEHVAAPQGSSIYGLQRMIRQPLEVAIRGLRPVPGYRFHAARGRVCAG